MTDLQTMTSFGRNRQSVADIDNQLFNIFQEHPNTHINDAGEPVIPADNLVDVFRSLTELYEGVPFLSDDETEQLNMLIKSNPGMEVTPQILLGFIAEKTRHPQPPPHTPPDLSFDADMDGVDSDFDHRGRSSDRDDTNGHSNGNGHHDSTRSSSTDSNPPTLYHSSGSRRSSFGGGMLTSTPSSASKSPFDTERRQRSQPLGGGSNAPPSSWTKRPAPHRRKSFDAGNRSDSESSVTTPPQSYNRTPSRRRTPSNPVSPSSSSMELFGPSTLSPPPFSSPSGWPSSRPHSRMHSAPQNSFASVRSDGSPDTSVELDENPLYDYDPPPNAFTPSGVSSVPLPSLRRSGSPGSDGSGGSEYDEEILGLVQDRTANLSTASLEPQERLDALQRTNTELAKKLAESERTLQLKMEEHEQELEEMQGKLEELRSELTHAKREEKELRIKEKRDQTQIAALEAEISKTSKQLEHSKATYANLQKQYQEQCAISEKYRDDLRARDELIRTLRDTATLHDLELAKWTKEHDAYEARVAALEQELEVAQAAHAQLDDQKQENLLLKETIDRMRWDMDEMRNGMGGGGVGPNGPGGGSNAGTLSKSLGAELLGKLGPWGGVREEEREEGEKGDGGKSEVEEEVEVEEVRSESVELGAGGGELEVDEGEDVIQTIITRTKRKVASRANWNESPSFNMSAFEESKEYSDSSTQYDPSYFYATHSTQTAPPPKILRHSLSCQTDPPPPIPSVFEMQTQTDPQPQPVPRVMRDMEAQTDTVVEVEVEPEEMELASPSGDSDQSESLASSSSTILPPTPRASSSHLLVEHLQLQSDSPPAYNQISPLVSQQQRMVDLLRRLHPGVSASLVGNGFGGGGGAFHQHEKHGHDVDEMEGLAFEPIPGGISPEALEDWRALREELGVGCAVIDKIVEDSVRAAPATMTSVPMRRGGVGKEKRGRFYNIYNKFYIGENQNGGASGGGGGGGGASAVGLRQSLPLWVGAGALVLLAIRPYMLVLLPQQQPYGGVPGGPTYYDRAAWSSFNGLGGGGEGFGGGVYGCGAGGGGARVWGAAGAAAAGFDGTAAVWKFLGRVGGGAVRIARGWPT